MSNAKQPPAINSKTLKPTQWTDIHNADSPRILTAAPLSCGADSPRSVALPSLPVRFHPPPDPSGWRWAFKLRMLRGLRRETSEQPRSAPLGSGSGGWWGLRISFGFGLPKNGGKSLLWVRNDRHICISCNCNTMRVWVIVHAAVVDRRGSGNAWESTGRNQGCGERREKEAGPKYPLRIGHLNTLYLLLRSHPLRSWACAICLVDKGGGGGSDPPQMDTGQVPTIPTAPTPGRDLASGAYFFHSPPPAWLDDAEYERRFYGEPYFEPPQGPPRLRSDPSSFP